MSVRVVRGLIEGLSPPRPLGYDMDALGGAAASLGEVADAVQTGILLTFLILIVLVVARFLLRNRWVAAVAVVLLTLVRGTSSTPSLIAALVAHVVSFLGLTAQCPDWSAWYAQAAVAALLLVAAFTA